MRSTCALLCLTVLFLAGCSGRGTVAPTPDGPVDTTVATAPAASPLAGSVPASTTDPLKDLGAIDTALQEVDNELCREALETRAEIEALLQQGQEVSDLAVAIDELIAELEACAPTETPTP